MGATPEVRKYTNLVVYDGVCKFCNASINFIVQHEADSDLKFTPLQSPLGQAILKMTNLPLDYSKSIIFVHDDGYYVKSRAAFYIARHLQKPWVYIRLFRFLPAFLTDVVYDLIARNRYKIWGKADSCILPTPAYRTRFLE